MAQSTVAGNTVVVQLQYCSYRHAPECHMGQSTPLIQGEAFQDKGDTPSKEDRVAIRSSNMRAAKGFADIALCEFHHCAYIAFRHGKNARRCSLHWLIFPALPLRIFPHASGW